MTGPNEKNCRAENFPARHSSWIGPAVVAVVFIFVAALTWRKWPDILVDFGTQLYIPWRLANGAVLYRDLFYFAGGPLSEYYHALLFKIFGVSFLTLIVSNLMLVAATLVLIYRRFRAAADAWTATMICLGIVLVFTFSEYTSIGNYNYIAPYSHEALHGLLLSIFTIALLSDWVGKGQIRFAAAAGFCSGLVFLTKPDIFIALAAGAAAAWVLFCATRRRMDFAAKSLAAFLSAGLVPPLIFFFYFLCVESWRESLRTVVFGWLPLFQGKIAENKFYQWCMGLDHPFAHLLVMVEMFLVVVMVIALYAFALRHIERLKSKWIRSEWIILLILISPLLLCAILFDWRACGTPLPPLCLSACVFICWNCKKFPMKPESVFPLLWSVFGLVLLLKLGLFPRIWHYGFALAMPAFVSTVYLLFWLLPVFLEKKCGVPSPRFRVTAGLVLLIGFGSLFSQSQLLYATKKLPVGRGADTIITFGPGVDIGEETKIALAWIEKNVPRDATLAVLPEGITLNYLTRRVNPTPCLFWDPGALAVFGQAGMTAAFEKNPPDYVLLVEKNPSEFGVGYFGRSPGYGGEVMQWIGENYATAILIGSEPLRDGNFGIKILKRISPTPPRNKIENHPPPD